MDYKVERFNDHAVIIYTYIELIHKLIETMNKKGYLLIRKPDIVDGLTQCSIGQDFEYSCLFETKESIEERNIFKEKEEKLRQGTLYYL